MLPPQYSIDLEYFLAYDEFYHSSYLTLHLLCVSRAGFIANHFKILPLQRDETWVV